jgi:hypothetical protein
LMGPSFQSLAASLFFADSVMTLFLEKDSTFRLLNRVALILPICLETSY